MHSLSATRGVIAVLIAIASTGSVSYARAATFMVNSTADHPPGPCESAVGGCTLREAVMAAVMTTGRDEIRFDPAVFPLGVETTILLGTPLPTIADPAGTAVDGAGTGVAISQIFVGSGTETIAGVVFASAPGLALANVMVANLTVRGFPGTGIHICGGVPPDCNEDVSGALVQNVLAAGNAGVGIEIEGRVVSRVRIADSVAMLNRDTGIACDASRAVAGVRIERCTARENDHHGIIVGGVADEVSDTAIADSLAVQNTAGIVVAATERVAKTKLTNLGAINNRSTGIGIETFGEARTTTITNAVASGNSAGGIEVLGDIVAGVRMKDVAATGNRGGIILDGDTMLTGVKITRAAAVGNEFDGIALRDHANGARITDASAVGNGLVGLLVAGSGLVIKRVRASENGEDGIRLAGTGSGNRVEMCSSTVNQGPGISIRAGSTANTVQKNVVLGNDAIDVLDANADCDANAWKKNVFETGNEPCIR